MNAIAPETSAEPGVAANAATKPRPPRRVRARCSLLANGEPSLWVTGGALVVALVMIITLLVLVVYQGGLTFWPNPIVEIHTWDGRVYLGEVAREDEFRPAAGVLDSLAPDIAARARIALAHTDGVAQRRLLRTGNYELTNTHFHWVSDFEIASEIQPQWALVVQRTSWGNFYGYPTAFVVDDKVMASAPAEIWALFNQYHPEVTQRLNQRVELEKHAIGAVSQKENEARLAMRQAELDHGKDSPQHAAAEKRLADVHNWARHENERIRAEIVLLNKANDRYQMLLRTVGGRSRVPDVAVGMAGLGGSIDGLGVWAAAALLQAEQGSREKALPLATVVRAYPANNLSWTDKMGIYASRWWEFLTARPREANTEGGVFPAIWGTVAMTLLMSILVVPFGVLAALYLREYAKAGPIISAVRIAVNNLAGVPSIVFGVFGLGFFCYMVGWNIDQLFFEANLPNPTYGKGGLIWASLTLALLTLPVVIVSTEEALAAVPSSMREGSYACGASKWQTIRRIVMPRAMPGIMTGMILAMARGAGEVAPIMLVGAVKLAPDLPIDFSDWSGLLGPIPTGPIHANRSFMHLGYHIFDVGFQSPNSEAARPMVYTTTLLLIVIIALLNLAAVWLRSRLRRRFLVSHF